MDKDKLGIYIIFDNIVCTIVLKYFSNFYTLDPPDSSSSKKLRIKNIFQSFSKLPFPIQSIRKKSLDARKIT